MPTVASPIDSALRPSDRTILKRWAIAVAVWGAAIGALSLTGGLSWMSPLALGPLVAVGIAVPVAVVRRSPNQRRLVREGDLAHLTWFNVWRVPAAIAFFVVGAQGLLPAPFVTNLAFHMFSFGDFLVAVGTGLTFTVLGDPVLGDPLMRTLLDTPMALIPLWGVPITGAVSLLALHRLLTEEGPRGRRRAAG
jgi:hypothetical protein